MSRMQFFPTRMDSSRMGTARLLTVCLLAHNSGCASICSPLYIHPPIFTPAHPLYSHPLLYSPPVFSPPLHIHPHVFTPLYSHPLLFSTPPYSFLYFPPAHSLPPPPTHTHIHSYIHPFCTHPLHIHPTFIFTPSIFTPPYFPLPTQPPSHAS